MMASLVAVLVDRPYCLHAEIVRAGIRLNWAVGWRYRWVFNLSYYALSRVGPKLRLDFGRWVAHNGSRELRRSLFMISDFDPCVGSEEDSKLQFAGLCRCCFC